MTVETNKVKVIGTVITEPIFCHETHGEKFFTFDLQVERKSDVSDKLPILISEKLLKNVTIGNSLVINGQIRTYNKKVSDKDSKKLVIVVFVNSVAINTEESNKETNNVVELDGFICKAPNYRTTPFGREITDLLVAVNRSTFNKSDYIPTIVWGRNAVYCKDLAVGTEIKIIGRLQSRDYNKKQDNGTVVVKTAYELSVIDIKIVEKEEKELD